MAQLSITLVNEIQRLVKNCTKKRIMLLQVAVARSKMKKKLTIASGVLALFSAGTITTVIIKLFGNEVLPILAAVSAAISGIISLILSAYYTDDETSKIYEGSSKYLLLRDKAYRLLINPTISNKEAFSALEKFGHDYFEYDSLYSKFSQYVDKNNLPLSTEPDRVYPNKHIDLNIVNEAVEAEMEEFNREVSRLDISDDGV